jgi:ribosomal protein L11 methyltransferase
VIRLAVRCTTELVELVPGGVEEDRGSGYVEYAIYGPPGELPALPDLEAAAGDGLVEIETTEIPDDWADRWRDFHEPVVVGGGRLVVRPSWETEAGSRAEIDIVIDPGQAFGTGAHATTRGCLELLLGLADGGEAGGALVDWGTGSGVLAIAAAKLGWEPVRGCDHEVAAIEAAEANARSNGISVELSRINLRDEVAPSAPSVVANLTSPLLLELARAVSGGTVAVPERLVLSGLLNREAEPVAAAFATGGLGLASRRDVGEWTALLLRS